MHTVLQNKLYYAFLFTSMYSCSLYNNILVVNHWFYIVTTKMSHVIAVHLCNKCRFVLYSVFTLWRGRSVHQMQVMYLDTVPLSVYYDRHQSTDCLVSVSDVFFLLGISSQRSEEMYNLPPS